MRRSLRVFGLSALCAVLSCAGRVQSPATATAPSKPVASTPKAASPRERLAQTLRSIPRPLPVLDALPEAARKRLDARLAGLDAERKLSVHNDESPLVESLPLLHLASGGTSPRALFALATTTAGTDELAGLLGVEHDAVADELAGSLGVKHDAVAPALRAARIALVRELSQRAALDFLRDRAADVLVTGKATALVCRLVARAALSVARPEIVLQARELLAEVEPSPENRLEFASELARAADPERATQVLKVATQDLQHPPRAAAVAAVNTSIAAARFVLTQRAADEHAVEARARSGLAAPWPYRGGSRAARTRGGCCQDPPRASRGPRRSADRVAVVSRPAAGCRRHAVVRRVVPIE